MDPHQDPSLMSPIPKKKRPSPTGVRPSGDDGTGTGTPAVTGSAGTTATATTDADLLSGHIPRKQKSQPHGDTTTTTTTTTAAIASSGTPRTAPSSTASSVTAPQSSSIQRKQQRGTKRNHPSSSVSDTSTHEGTSRRRTSSSGATDADAEKQTPPSRMKRHYIQVLNENPIVLKIQLDGVPMTMGIAPRMRQAKKTTVHYEEATLTDSDDFLTDTDEEGIKAQERKRKKKRQRLHQKQQQHQQQAQEGKGAPRTAKPNIADPASLATTDNAPTIITDAMYGALSMDSTAPPEGTLHTLWYSREVFMNILVMERIVGWKTRPVVQLVTVVPENNDTAEDNTPHIPTLYTLPQAEAQRWQEKALQTNAFWNDASRRMAVSRAAPAHCPTVLTLAAIAEAKQAAAEQRSPRYVLHTIPNETEEILLVKWRGRSHMHCSWERPADIYRVDAGNNTAKQKIKRFYDSQELMYGSNWRKALQEELDTTAVIQSHHGAVAAVPETTAAEPGGTTSPTGDEYFPAQYLELERILACDESEMNMEVLAKQRAKNILAEQEDLALKEKASDVRTAWLDHVVEAPEVSESWDPEDNVRYVVKWKGLPTSEMTWEYWRDIKRDGVDLAEDFWYRQQPPTVQEVKDAVLKKHPSLGAFSKLKESPVYGISARSRPVASLEGESPSSPEDEESPFEGFRLRSYQLEGVNWLLFNWWNKRSCILADEMGLGKTIQSAAFMHQLQTNPHTKIRGPFLIVAPLSLVGQWQSELASWAPDMNVVLYHGSAAARDFLVEHEFYYNEPFVQKSTAAKFKKQNITKFHVCITTYEVCLKDTAVLSKIKWRALIVDEAHRLKNHKSRLFEDLANVNRDYCLLLTGTPIANATEELFSLLHFANPTIFKDREEFIEKFGQMTDVEQVNELHSLLRPYLLRRVKEDVEKSLPPKEETILEISLTPIQKAYYKAIYERNTSFLFKGAKANNAPSLMNVMMELRKCCNHPFLVKGAEERILGEAATKAMEKAKEEGEEVVYPEPHLLFADQLVKSSGKMVLMEKLLQKLFVGGHKVLIFSQMVRVLDLLEELLKIKRYRYERLDGSTSSSSRLAAVDRFKRKSCQRFVMLLSTRAGGLGLNLTAADIVIIFDSDWNPQNDLQAMARAHRIGQQRSVKIYRLLTAKTYEMHMFHSASLKLGLERAVLSQNREQSDDNDDSKSKRKSDKEAQAKQIDELLKKGAYDVFRDEDDTEAERFMKTDIDQLLENSSKRVTYGAASTSSIGSGLGSFSKASFVADTGSGEKDVDLDDPDFWSKAVGLEVPIDATEEELQMLDDGVKRSRKQVQVYDPYAETAQAERMKKEKIAMEKMLEKEERERARLDKKLKKEAAKEKKRQEREESKHHVAEKAAAAIVSTSSTSPKPGVVKSAPKPTKEEAKKPIVEVKPRKSKKNDRLRVLRRAENENPILEQLRQAWEVPHRNRATAAILRFGFKRFCKIRGEANLNSLPLQDIEIFTRAYLYQIALQAGASLFQIAKDSSIIDIRSHLPHWLGDLSDHEITWVAGSINTAMEYHKEVEAKRRFLRMPVILCEPSFVADLRNGCALRALRRLGVLARLNDFVETCLDKVLNGLGHEELGKRGCASSDLSSLDPDLKARFVTTEELSLVISAGFSRVRSIAPTTWWDRYCDVALIVGTFVHGLSNYKAMRADPELPFSEKVKRNATQASRSSYHAFVVAASAARAVFDDALEAGRVKAELEVQAAVAAAAKAASKREEDAALLREGGDGVEDVIRNMPETQVENAFEFDGTDSHFVTLLRLHKNVRESLAHKAEEILSPDAIPEEFTEGTIGRPRTEGAPGRPRSQMMMSMPDARLLDHRLLEILAEVESSNSQVHPNVDERAWQFGEETSMLNNLRRDVLSRFYGERLIFFLREYSGIGLAGAQCGTTHRALDDGTDFAYGSASPPLSLVAYGTDAPRYLRALGVPMNVTRFALSALSYADSACVEQLLSLERKKFYTTEGDARLDKTSPTFDEKAISALPVAGEDGSASLIQSENASSSSLNKGKETTKTRNEMAIWEPLEAPMLVPETFRADPKGRAMVCLGVLLYGFPSIDELSVSTDLLALAGLVDDNPLPCFDVNQFRDSVQSFDKTATLPDASAITEYVESSLLPHCLRLCLYGNGPTTRDARGSQGEYETALGVSLHPSPSKDSPCQLPDPCREPKDHSLEALGVANAILRRTQLLRSIRHLCSGAEITALEVSTASRSKLMDCGDNLPVWWCPWVHDVGLLIRAASAGLLSVLDNRTEDKIFSQNAISDFLRTSLNDQPLPFSDRLSSEVLDEWIRYEAGKFPTLLQIERRMAFLTAKATATATDPFVTLPMFDHGGWPRE